MSISENVKRRGLFAGVAALTAALLTKAIERNSDVANASGSVIGNALSSTGSGVTGFSSNGQGVTGICPSGTGVSGGSADVFGVFGSNLNTNSAGVSGSGLTGVFGIGKNSGQGVLGANDAFGGVGVQGSSQAGTAIVGITNSGFAGRFLGPVSVTGNLSKGGGSFRIDHPLDPQNKFLEHSFVESPDMKNIYDGVDQLDANGEATVSLPDWFEALNRDFRYQLTAIGGPAPGLYVADEIGNNRFRIAGGTPAVRVAWQVTGIRKDPYANLHRITVEVKKPPQQRGRYLHPDAYGLPPTAATEHDQQMTSRIRDMQNAVQKAAHMLGAQQH